MHLFLLLLAACSGDAEPQDTELDTDTEMTETDIGEDTDSDTDTDTDTDTTERAPPVDLVLLNEGFEPGFARGGPPVDPTVWTVTGGASEVYSPAPNTFTGFGGLRVAELTRPSAFGGGSVTLTSVPFTVGDVGSEYGLQVKMLGMGRGFDRVDYVVSMLVDGVAVRQLVAASDIGNATSTMATVSLNALSGTSFIAAEEHVGGDLQVEIILEERPFIGDGLPPSATLSLTLDDVVLSGSVYEP